mgnify:CR=1 FL=1
MARFIINESLSLINELQLVHNCEPVYMAQERGDVIWVQIIYRVLRPLCAGCVESDHERKQVFDWNFVKTCVRSIWESSSTDSQDHPWLAMLIHSSNWSSVLWKVQWLQHTMLKSQIFVQKVDLDQTFFWIFVKFNQSRFWLLSTQKCYLFWDFWDKMWTFGIVCKGSGWVSGLAFLDLWEKKVVTGSMMTLLFEKCFKMAMTSISMLENIY